MKEIILKLHHVAIGKRDPKIRRTPPNLLNSTFHWKTKQLWKHAWQDEVRLAYIENKYLFPELPLKHPKITIILYKAGIMFDKDGAYAACKPLLDQLKVNKGYIKAYERSVTVPGLGIIEDDSEDDIDYEVIQKRIKKQRDEGVDIIIAYEE